jgi:hypothetical protein
MNTPRNQEPSADPFERYSISNDTKLCLYLADRDRNGNLYPIEKYKIVFNRFVKFLSQSFGGCTLLSSEGAYMNEQDKILYENTKLIYSYCDYNVLIEKKSELVSLLEEYLTFTDQESALFCINDKPYYIYNPEIINLDLQDEEILKKEQEEQQEEHIEKIIHTDLDFKKFYNYNNMIKYIESHLIYSTYPIFTLFNNDMIRYTEGEDLSYGDIIYIHGNSNYDYDRLFKVVAFTKHFIKYKQIIPHKILEYFCNDNWGSSRMTYKYNYNICQNQTYRRNIHNQYIKLNDNFKNTDFLYITNYLH